MDLAERGHQELHGPRQADWMERLATEHDNLRAALTWVEATPNVDMELRITAALALFWMRAGHLAEGRRALDLALARGANAPAGLRANALSGAGRLARIGSEHAQATRFIDQAIDLYRGLADNVGLAYGLFYRATVASEQGENNLARALFEESLALFRSVDDQWGAGASLNGLGIVAELRRDYPAARRAYEEALKQARERGDPANAATCLVNLALVAIGEGDDPRALEAALEGLRLVREERSEIVANTLETLATAWGHLGQFERSGRLFGAGERLREETGAPLGPAWKQRYDEAVNAIRDNANGAVFDEAWARGRTLSASDATAYALDEMPGASLVVA
jgi:tetratricopeptide (TPR) repeat protein